MRLKLTGPVLALSLALTAPTFGAGGGLRTHFPLSPRTQAVAVVLQKRLQAIENTFGEVLELFGGDLTIRFADPAALPDLATVAATYDAAGNILTFRRDLIGRVSDDTSAAASSYWWYYEHPEMQNQFPSIEIIDDALWNAVLAEVAGSHDLVWPPQNCSSNEVSSRLACQMMMAGIKDHLHSRRGRLYNENRLDMLWPEDLQSLERFGWQHDDPQYDRVRTLGGAQLIRPLMRQFGTARVLAYVAQTPFNIEQNNVRESALMYQARARSALSL
ncbi:MAG: hypothetical protein ACJ8MH_09195 [Povalibacter sp.]